MRKVTIFCDRCGKQIRLVSKLLTTFSYNVDNTEDPEDVEDGAELCIDCYNEIDDMVAFMVKNPTIHFDGGKQIVPKDPKKQNNRTKLDIGKIGALIRAGWSMSKIADEMGVSAQTIANHKEEALALLAKQDLAEELENDIQEV